MDEENPNKKGSFEGCLTLIIIIFFVIRIFIFLNSDQRKPKILETFIETEELNLSDSLYTIKNRDKNLIHTNYNWSYVTTTLQKRDMNINIEVSKSETDLAMEILESMLYLTYGDLDITADFNNEKELYHWQYWTGMYRYLVVNTGSQIEFISNSLINIAKNENLNRNDLLNLCITMVQNIEYKIPEGTLGIIPPINSIANEYGDCDTISILLYAILDDLGFDTVLYLSRAYTHAMLGINTNSTGKYKTFNGKPYYFLEVTNVGWGLGQISSDMQDLDKWVIIDL